MRRARAVLAVVVIVLFVLTVGLGILLPLYTDEVVVKMQTARMLIEGARVVSVFPQCGPTSFTQALPLTWYPAAVVNFVLFGGLGLLGIKLSGLVFAFLWFGIVARFFRRRRTRSELATFLALHAIGVVPLGLASARAEPILLLCLGAFVAFPFARRSRFAVTAGFIALTSIFYFAHPKALLFTPVVFLSLVLTFGVRRRRAWFVLPALFLVATIVQTRAVIQNQVACPGRPELHAILAWQTLDPGGDLAKLVRTGVENLPKHTLESANAMRLEPVTAAWLPPGKPTSFAAFDRLNEGALVLLFVGAPIFVLFGALRGWRRQRLRRPIAFAVLLVACTMLHMFLSSSWNYYNVPLVVGVLVLAVYLVRLGEVRSTIVQLFAVASMALVLVSFGPRFWALAKLEGTVLPGQPAWVPVFGYGRERAIIRAHAASCNIRGDGATHLVIDDATLFAFDRLKEPYHVIYVTDDDMWAAGLDGPKDVAMLAELGASGIISRCAYFPTALLPKAKRAGGYCCVDPADIHRK